MRKLPHLTLDDVLGEVGVILVVRQLEHGHGVADGRERIAQFVGEHRQKLVFSTVVLLQLFLVAFAVGHVARRSGDGLHRSIKGEHGCEDIIVDPASIGSLERNFATDRTAGFDDLIDLAVVHLGVPRFVGTAKK